MSPSELNVFMLMLNELVTIIHSETTIPKDQPFEQSVIGQYLEMIKVILYKKSDSFGSLVSDSVKSKLQVTCITVYSDYSRFQDCESMMSSAIETAQCSKSWDDITKLIVIRCQYFSLIVTERGDDQYVEEMLRMIREQRQSDSFKLPMINDLFLRFLSIGLCIKFNVKCTENLRQITEDLVSTVTANHSTARNSGAANSNDNGNGRKRKFGEITDSDNFEIPQKRQRLNDGNGLKLNLITNPDHCFLLNYCSLISLMWIARNSLFQHETLDGMKEEIAFLLDSNICDVDTEKMTFFEREIMHFFKERQSQQSQQTDSIVTDGRYFEETLIPLLHRIDEDYCSEHRVRESKLLKHLQWVNINGLSKVIESLFHCLQSMHRGEMERARTKISQIETHLTTKGGVIGNGGNDLGALSLRFLIWTISIHLGLVQHDGVNEQLQGMGSVMKQSDEIKLLLKNTFCRQKLSPNPIANPFCIFFADSISMK